MITKDIYGQYSGMCRNDTLVGRMLHDKYPTTFEPSHTLFLITNDRVAAPGHDFAFWRRVLRIPFEARFVNRKTKEPNKFLRDKQLLEKLKTEAHHILAWMLEGCLYW